MDSSGEDGWKTIPVYDYWTFEHLASSNTAKSPANSNASEEKRKSQPSGGPAYPLRSKVGTVFYYELRLLSNIPQHQANDSSVIDDRKAICFGIGSTRTFGPQGPTEQQNEVYVCKAYDKVVKAEPSKETKNIASTEGDTFRCEFDVDGATVVYKRNGSVMLSQKINENCHQVEFMPVIGTGDASISIKMERRGIFYKPIANSLTKPQLDVETLSVVDSYSLKSLAALKSRFNALRAHPSTESREEKFYVDLYDHLRLFSGTLNSPDAVESEQTILFQLLTEAATLKSMFETYDSSFQLAQEIVSKNRQEDRTTHNQGTTVNERISSFTPAKLSADLELAVQKRTEVDADLLRLSHELKSKHVTQRLTNNVHRLKCCLKLFSDMPTVPMDLSIHSGSFNGFQSTFEDFFSTEVSHAIVSIEDWQKMNKDGIRSNTDIALSNLWSSLSDMSADAAHTNSKWKEAMERIIEEEEWSGKVKNKPHFPADVKRRALNIKHTLEEEIKLYEEAIALFQRAFKKYTAEKRPQKPTEIKKLMELKEKSKKARRDLMIAQVMLKSAILDGLSPEEDGEEKQNVEKCIWKYRAVCKEVENELSSLVNITATDFPELPLLFPQADLLRIDQISKEGLMKFGVFFNPSSQDQVHDGCYRNPQRIHYGRHAVFKAELDGRECVLKEYNLRHNSDSRRLVREVLMLNKLNHQGIVKIEGVVMGEQASTAYVQMPYFRGGNMKEWLERKDRSKDEIRAILHEVTKSVEYLHSKNIVHSDIKLENIFMSSDESFASPTLGDFDISKENDYDSQAASTTMVGGTNIYLAPERLHGGCATPKSDIFALGMTMLFAAIPNRTEFSEALFRQNPEQRYTTVISKVKSLDDHHGRRGLILSMLHDSPNSRPAASHINESSYLNFSGVTLELAKLKEEEDKKKKLEEEMNPERSCSICLLDKREIEGVVCPNSEMRTFVCDSCFQEYVSEQSLIENIEVLSKHDGKIACPTRKYGCPDTCFFADSSVAQHVTANIFEKFSLAKKAVLERTLRKTVQDEERLKYEQQLSKLQQLTENQRIVFLTRKKIEDLLNMKCPVENCRAVFEDVEKDHCMALRCRSCSTAFCGWCLKNCKADGNDAHSHVMKCTVKPKRSTYWDYSPGRREWRRVTSERQWSEISKELKTLDQNIFEDVLSAILPLLRQREMDTMLRKESWNERGWKEIVDRTITRTGGTA